MRKKALEQFHDKWEEDANVMDKWFSLQATSPIASNLEEVKDLVNHKLFEITNPNKVRSLFNTFANLNPYSFHARDGQGYAFIADKVIELNTLNPMIASRLLKSMINWKILEPKRAELLKKQLHRINKHELSPDIEEILRKSLEQ
jgi:aminopeptidase N